MATLMPRPGFHEFTVRLDQAGDRLDRVLGAQPGFSRGLARRLIDAGAVFVNGRRVRRQSRPVRAGDRIRAPLALPPKPEVDLTRRILHRDERLLVVDKPAGIASAPTPHGVRGTLPALLAEQLGLARPPWVVHRLDRDASGVLALGLTRAGTRLIMSWFTGPEARRAQKWYRALVHGVLPDTTGTYTAPIARDRARPGRMKVSPRGAAARTDYQVLGPLAGLPGCSAVALRLYTGRTHQLRLHLADLGCPVLGDRWYGGPRRILDSSGQPVAIPRLCLHAQRLVVPALSGRGEQAFEAPLPEIFDAWR